jgi:hypothetical protein
LEKVELELAVLVRLWVCCRLRWSSFSRADSRN